MHVWVPERGGKTYTCCFEVKVDRNDWIPIDAKSDALIRRISTRLAEANDQLSKHGHPEAVYRCGLMTLRVYCRESKWKKWGMKSKTYDDKVKGLTEELEHALHAITGAESKPNFWWRYFASRKVIQSGCWKERGNYRFHQWVSFGLDHLDGHNLGNLALHFISQLDNSSICSVLHLSAGT